MVLSECRGPDGKDASSWEVYFRDFTITRVGRYLEASRNPAALRINEKPHEIYMREGSRIQNRLETAPVTTQRWFDYRPERICFLSAPYKGVLLDGKVAA